MRGTRNRTPLHYAAAFNRLIIVEFLLSKGAKHDVLDGEDTAPMIDMEILVRYVDPKKLPKPKADEDYD